MEEYLDILKEHIKCFNFKEEDFDYLKEIPVDEMGLMNERIYKITPLLDEITLYAYGAAFYNIQEYEMLSERNNISDEVNQVMETCFNYVNSLIENDCHHPSILVYKDMVNSDCLYESMMSALSDSINYVEDEEVSNELINISCDVDNTICEFIDESYAVLAEQTENKSSKEILNLFGTIGRDRGMAELLLFNTAIIAPVCDTWIRFLNGQDIVLTNKLISMIQIIDKELPYVRYGNNSEELEDAFNNIKESYELYKCFQGDYYKNSYKEARLLEKCKKM